MSHQTHVIDEAKNSNINLIDAIQSVYVSTCLIGQSCGQLKKVSNYIPHWTMRQGFLTSTTSHNLSFDGYELEKNVFEKHTIIVEDLSYFDFELTLVRHLVQNYFVTKIKPNSKSETIEEKELPSFRVGANKFDEVLRIIL